MASEVSTKRLSENEIQALFDKSDKEIKEEFAALEKAWPFDGRLKLYNKYGYEPNLFYLARIPKEEELDRFLKLVRKVKAVISLTQLEEKNKLPSQPFDPDYVAQHSKKYSLIVRVLKKGNDIEESELELCSKKTGKVTRVPRYHYLNWKDAKVTSPEAIAELGAITLKYPLSLIHCKRGRGRTGVLATVVASFQRIAKFGYRWDNIILPELWEIRADRRGCVQNLRQYKAVYKGLYALLKKQGLIG